MEVVKSDIGLRCKALVAKHTNTVMYPLVKWGLQTGPCLTKTGLVWLMPTQSKTNSGFTQSAGN